MADNRKYYVICEDNCKFEGMTKEQICAAIYNAVNDGSIGDIDAGFITTIKTINGNPLKFFVGTQNEYERLNEDQRENLFAVITNDTAKDGIDERLDTLSLALEQLAPKVNELERTVGGWNTGATVVPNAENANGLSMPLCATLAYNSSNTMITLTPNTIYFVLATVEGAPVKQMNFILPVGNDYGYSSSLAAGHAGDADGVWKLKYVAIIVNGVKKGNVYLCKLLEGAFNEVYPSENYTLKFYKIADYPS